MNEIRRRTEPATAASEDTEPAVPSRPRITRSDLTQPRVTPTGRFSFEEYSRPYVYRDPARQGSLAVRATAR